MDLNEIQALIKFVSKSGASEVELETKDFKIVIKTPLGAKAENDKPTIIHSPIPIPAAVPVANSVAPAPEAKEEAKAPSAAAPAEVVEKNNYITVKSPMIGTFYRSSSPDKPSFVNIGDSIKPGQVVCIIEAMKLFNEIESEISGKVIKVLVDDATPVEYDQPLFLVDPS
jgi:acetyl-CoA carboxylase biotin carboxyl carrier protein